MVELLDKLAAPKRFFAATNRGGGSMPVPSKEKTPELMRKTPEMLAREAEVARVQAIMEKSLSTQKAEELADHHMEVRPGE